MPFLHILTDNHDKIHSVCKEALYEGLKNIRYGSYINDCSKDIQEVINSYDFEIIKGVTGHSISRYNIHSGINIHNHTNKYDFFNYNRFKKGAYAIEPFISYNSNRFYEGSENNNYKIINKNSKLYDYFNNLIFTDSHIEYYNINNIFHQEKNILNIIHHYI